MQPSERIEYLKGLVAQLPLEPGVYQYLDKTGKVIYVGKAKSLRRRVSSYFVDSKEHSAKVRALVRQIADIRHIVVGSETDALLLENSLIKTLQPRYNILLKDDKTYPWIVVRNEPFPRVESTRRVLRDGSQYFGPYASIAMQRSVLEFIREVYTLRTCRLNLEPEKIARGKYNVCLQYHLGNCKGPCIGAQTEQDYGEDIARICSTLRGDMRSTRAYLEEQMQKAAAELRFEAAARYKNRLAALDNYSSKSVIVNSSLFTLDIFSLLLDDEEAYCNFVRIVSGAVTGTFTAKLSTGIDSSPRDILTQAIRQISEQIAGRLAHEVVVPFLPETSLFEGITFTVPKRGDKLKLLEFSEKSARIYRAEQLKNLEIRNPERHTERLMNAMKRELHLDRQPRHIECFDNSNLQGTNPVASCVVFRDGRPSKNEYRHFNIKTVVGADDFASMREIVRRRYSRLLEEGAELPDLIVVDGGKGQLSSAYSVLCELGIEKQVPIVGLAKRIEEIYFPFDPEPYYLDRTGEPLKVITHLRDEAHRFGITFHRQKRSKAFINSELEQINGIGSSSVEALLTHFRTVRRIRKASLEELEKAVGTARARKVFDHFHPQPDVATPQPKEP